MLINGEWVTSSTCESFPAINPYNQSVWAQIPQASEKDVNSAIMSAQNAFRNTWAHTNGIKRASLLYKLAELIEQNAERLAQLETTDNGKVIRETKTQMMFAARNYRFFAGYADKLYGNVIPLDNPTLYDYTIPEPIGVVALITSWNSPISILTNKLAPALAAGNTVVIKPSEHTSATTLELGKLIQEAGFPDGVVNIVTGDGRVGDALTKNKHLGKISFTGGSKTGTIISRNASEFHIPVTLELGGKSPNIIFEDANLESAVSGAIAGIFGASGQTCIAGSRLLVQKSIYEEVVNKIIQRTNTIKLGNPLDVTTEMGPVANMNQFNAILSMIQKGKDEGAQVLTGGLHAIDEGLEEGLFIKPTIFGNVDNGMTIAQEEIFGPVLCVIPFIDDEEAIKIANDSVYGLASGIWTQNLSRAHLVAKRIKAGTVWVNTYRTTAAQAPFGGVKQSGHGRERGYHALLDYTQVKNVMIDLNPSERDPFSIRV